MLSLFQSVCRHSGVWCAFRGWRLDCSGTMLAQSLGVHADSSRIRRNRSKFGRGRVEFCRSWVGIGRTRSALGQIGTIWSNIGSNSEAMFLGICCL